MSGHFSILNISETKGDTAIVTMERQPEVICALSEHLPSPDRVSGTAFLLPSVIRHCRRQSSEGC